MRRTTQDWWSLGHIPMMLQNLRRRHAWFTDNASAHQIANFVIAGTQFFLKSEVLRAWPVLVKVDISPLCNLKCVSCVHAQVLDDGDELLRQQSFSRNQKMSVAHFERIVSEVAGKALAVSLYYLGDPLVHPDLDQMCQISAAARLNSHVATNFSFRLSDERLYRLLTSGLTHFTASVDGMRQESYELTRVGGRIDLVLDNLDRLLKIRRELGQKYPKVEVQYIKFQHNVDQLKDAIEWSQNRGVDQFSEFWGDLHNYADHNPERLTVFGPKSVRAMPQCMWPYFSIQIKYDGDVIPCCVHRLADQYRTGYGVDSRAVGNIFSSSIWEVWNSPEYRTLRQFVSNPQRALHDSSLSKTFCDACPTIFDTDIASHLRTSDKHDWHELYGINEGESAPKRK